MMPAAWKPFLVVVSLLLVLTYLWMQSTSPDLYRRNQWQEIIRIIELRDAELVRDVLLARAGLLPNYDALTQAGQELIHLSSTLSVEIKPASSDAGKALGNSVAILNTTLQDKLVHVEYFKSDNALLRNSVTYFDLVGRTLRSRAKPGATAKIVYLWQAMLSFMETPEPSLAQEIQAELDRLAKVRPLPGDYQALIAHGRLIVEVLPKLDALLRQIIDSSIVAHADDLQVALREYSREVEAHAQTYRFLLYLVAVILVGYLLYQFARIRANTLDLRRAHANLQQETVERLQAETSLRESEECLRAITESAHEAIVSVDRLGNIMSWNWGATVMFGYPVGDALGIPFLSLIPSHHQYVQEQLLAEGCATLNPNSSPIELTGVRQDSSQFLLELSLSSWTRGAERYMTAIIRDISARKRLEETTRQQELKLIQANKMAALGTLVSGVAHEINNPNQLILLNSGLLADAWSDALEILEDYYRESGEFSLGGLPYTEMRKTLPVLVYDIKDGAKRIERIVTDLKNFARPKGVETQVLFSLNEVVERAVRLLGHLIGRKTAHFEIDLAEPSAFLLGDPQQVEQVVVNLLVNALESLPDQECGVTVATFPVNGSYEIYLEVRDEGIGIAPEHLEQLCDPFFTTKQAMGGTGLGLAITASLVRAHGGRLSFSSVPGKGTRARAIFPEPPP